MEKRGSKPGERRGGRIKGVPNKKPEERALAVKQHIERRAVNMEPPPAGSVLDPVDALCELMAWALDEFRSANARDEDGSFNPDQAIAKAKLGMVAADWAAKAAPYLRPRLNAIEAKVSVSVEIYDRINRARDRASNILAA